MGPHPPVLLADDDQMIVYTFRRAYDKAGIPNPLIVARDGQEVLDYLSQPFTDLHPMPGLLLLDLTMPRKTGFDVLAWLGKQPHLHGVPTVVLSSSNHPDDMAAARELGAMDYRVKPHRADTLVALIQDLHARWLSAVPASA